MIGVTCASDINECATNNAGCGPLQTCTNLFPLFNCTAVIYPGSVFSIEPVFSQPPVVFDTMLGQSLDMFVSHSQISLPRLSVTLGTASDPALYLCSNLTAIAPIDPVQQRIRVQCPPGAGTNLFVNLWLDQLLVSTDNETVRLFDCSFFVSHHFCLLTPVVLTGQVSFPPPQIFDNTLRRNSTGYSATRTSTLALDTSLSVQVQVLLQLALLT